MGLLAGPLSVTRCTVTARPNEPDFEGLRFVEVQPGSQILERIGFVPFEPGAPYRLGHSQWAFRVRVDRVRPDPAAVAERLKSLLAAEREATGDPFVPAHQRKKLRRLAEEELLQRTAPRTKIVEGFLDDTRLYLGTTANAWLGIVLAALREIGVVADFSSPWLDRAEPDLESEVVDTTQPWQAVRGCRFLRALTADPEVMVEPERGAVRLATRDARVGLTGGVLNDVLHYLEQDAEILAAKLVLGDSSFRLDGLNWRLSGIRVETERHDSWADTLSERVAAVAGIYERLDDKYGAVSKGW
jgi:hypothetical protein